MNTKQNDFYQSQRKLHTQQSKILKNKLRISSGIRLLVFLCIAVGVYTTFGNTQLVLFILIVGIVLFLFLVNRHTNLRYQHDLTRQLIAQNEIELEVLQHRFHHLPDGQQFKDPLHHYSQDIDLFGRGSFFQYCNRTALESGTKLLASLLLENAIDHIPAKQKAIQELSNMSQWRQRFSAIASLVKTEVTAQGVQKWITNYVPFIPSWIRVGTTIFSIISLTLIVLYFTINISGNLVLGWFLLGLGISALYVKKVNKLSAHTSKIQSTFQQFYQLVLEIENTTFTSQTLKEKQALIINEIQSASKTLKAFASYLNALDQRSNMLVGIVANGFMLRDLKQCDHIEKWIAANTNNVSNWFKVISFFDAYNSLGNYTFNHSNHHFPEIVNNTTILKTTRAVHPLLQYATAIANDITINEGQFFIITGANMAGKSTFLRTVGLQIVMANIGLPVGAEKTQYKPIKLITSMRTTDSLTDDTSYFFGELKRLKLIVDQIKTERYFIILDEILKGTNSTDKAIGSRKFVEKLVGSNATGIIATHDLSLCEAANSVEQIKNYYFDARIENDELFFDYKFKKGICENMNASFLLKKMEIVD